MKENINFEDTKSTKLSIIRIICLIFVGIFSVFVIVNILVGNYFVSAINGSGLICMIICLLTLHMTGNTRITTSILCLYAYIVIITWIVTGGAEGFGPLWLTILPPVAVYIMNLKDAAIACSGLMVILALLLWSPLKTFIYPYNSTFLMRFPILYLAQIAASILIKQQIDKAEKHRDEMLALAIRYQEEAERANYAKTDFLSHMSHEIRTPLNAIIGMNEMILRESKEEQTIEYARTMQHSSRVLLTIINDILDITKIEAGKMKIVNQEYELSSLISDCYDTVSEVAEDKGLSFSVSCDARLPKTLYGDNVRIRQIIVNILGNAVKYTHEGSVTMKLSGERQGSFLNMTVVITDTGVGMTRENIRKLFDKFERFDLHKNHTIEGTGLGMSITQQLVQLLNGQIDVQSEYGKGSTFTVTLPQVIADTEAIGELNLAQVKRQALEPGQRQQFIAPEAHILVVDDMEINQKVAVNLLKNTEVQIDTANSGKECIALTQQKKYDIIFMDHMMPGMDGIATLKIIQGTDDNPNNVTPVIMLTANALSGAKEKFLDVGFRDYLTKPILQNSLEEMVEKYLPPQKIILLPADTEQRAETTAVIPPNASEVPCDRLSLLESRLPELQSETALTYCAGSREFLIQLLEDYANKDKKEKIETFYADQDWKNYTVEVHALKSTSKTLGLLDLSQKAEQLELAAKQNDISYIEQHQQELIQHYGNVLNVMRQVF